MQLATQNDLEPFHQFLGEKLKSGQSSLTPEDSVVALRTIEILERIGGPEARGVLQKLAQGASGAIETEESKADSHAGNSS